MKTIFVTYYSDISSTFYQENALRLQKQIQNLGGVCYVENLPSLGSYAANCLRKPKYILECLEKYKQPLIWIDADSIVNRLPVEFDNIDADIACVEKANGCPESALIYFNNTEKSKQFLEKWIEECSTDKPELDHPVLKEMWFNKKYNEKRVSLPDSICSVRTDSKIQIILSNTVGKREHTRHVMERRQQEGKIQ